MNANQPSTFALDSARRKAYLRLIPLLILCYMIAYIDRKNVSFAMLTMKNDLPAFTEEVVGFGAGIFFLGYFLLEIPGSLLVEKWSARKWICRIMISWGIMAALQAAVSTPTHFYGVRFLLGLAEAGFFPGVIVYLTHWFTSRDRARALALFLIATPIADIISPKISNLMLGIGTTEIIDGATVVHPLVLGMTGWQWVYVFWGVPAIVLGIVVWYALTDRPRDAKWLLPEEREALEEELIREKTLLGHSKHMSLFEALTHPKVLLLSLAYFCVVTANYGIEFFLPKILEDWYQLKLSQVTTLAILPPLLVLVSQIFVGWSSDYTKERRFHVVVPIAMAAIALVVATQTRGTLWMTVVCLMIASAGWRAYLPAFWALPNLFLAEAAAAGSIGLINSVGNLGGFLGPSVLGWVRTNLGSYENGLLFLSGMAIASSCLIFFLGLGTKAVQEGSKKQGHSEL